ncbi:MAG TPA: hypothetical protein VIW93_12585 [Candidatus Acidoferrum sp.]
MMKQIAEASPRFKARIAGVSYLINILTGALALFARDSLGVAKQLRQRKDEHAAKRKRFYRRPRRVPRGQSG